MDIYSNQGSRRYIASFVSVSDPKIIVWLFLPKMYVSEFSAAVIYGNRAEQGAGKDQPKVSVRSPPVEKVSSEVIVNMFSLEYTWKERQRRGKAKHHDLAPAGSTPKWEGGAQTQS